MAREEYDWIDDAFDDKKNAEELNKAKGPKFAGILLVVVVLVAVVVVIGGFLGILGAMKSL